MYLWLINCKLPYNITVVGCNFLRNAVAGLANLEDRTALIPESNHMPRLSVMIERRPMALVSAISAIDEAALLDQAFDPVDHKLFRKLTAVVQCVPASSAADERTFSFGGRMRLFACVSHANKVVARGFAIVPRRSSVGDNAVVVRNEAVALHFVAVRKSVG